ncbi:MULTISPECIES: extracellular solute-binding protein [unclassified Achromobacter]|uniref:sensor histidine kinase n=1 Tax=unclassified Achromobacter TaxID=2626865 RepID=UPI000B5162D2|nr:MULTISPECIES: extracellular solute-binding protein [unclassified Achromobacter]OWT75873.1 HAMP domain-containing histidine kinase [Achromobacter sp. HZ28]OWT76723.1 HAMP domain-containing histidine kinase [Achromobacter sp. HZ34]
MGLLLLGCASIGVALFLHHDARRAADRAFDRLLAASALTIAGSVRIDDGGIVVEPPHAALAMLSGMDRVFYTARGPDGAAITGYDDLAWSLEPARSSSPVFDDIDYRDEPVRVATVGRLVAGGPHAGWVTIRVAETLDARNTLTTEIWHRAIAPLLVIVPLALALLWFGLRRAFAPLAAMEQELSRRDPDDLRPLDMPAPREVTRLAEALNGVMPRLESAMRNINTLVADAAHQVRTPLASLRAQAEVAMEETDPQRLHERVTRIHQNATLASQLVSQLLMDATITHRLGMRGTASVGIAEIVNDTRNHIGPLEATRLRIFIAPEVRRARVTGDRVALREMLRNLVDNALRYAEAGPVEIRVTPVAAMRVAITVNDDGPGIPDNEMERVQERFQRGTSGAGQPGSGLGLAIVRTVANAHGGTLWLQNRPGGGLAAKVVMRRVKPAYKTAHKTAHKKTLAVLALAMAGLLAATSAPAPARAQTSTQPLAQTRAQAPAEAGAEGNAQAPAAVPARACGREPETTRYPTATPGDPVLAIAGTTDTPTMSGLIQAFQNAHPGVAVTYREMGSRALYEAAVADHLPDVDVLMSPATDLQIRLANDGYALRYETTRTAGMPEWATWRNEVFGFTLEPVVIVYNPRRYTEATAPRSHQALLRLLESEGAALHGRIGTYDLTRSSVGYLLAEQDEQVSSDFWGLAHALGRAGVRRAACATDILDAIERDELDLGYNVLGSHALAREAASGRIGVVFPQDYELVLTRSVLIARKTRQPALARALVDWLLSPAGQAATARQAGLGSLIAGTPGPWTADGVLTRTSGIVQPIAMGPGLLAGLDRQRQARFIRNWARLVGDTPPASLPPPRPSPRPAESAATPSSLD